MAKFGDTAELIKCAFCGKSQKQVKKLIAGPGVHICDECIELCNEIVDEEFGQSAEVGLEELPIPRDIRAFLDEYVVGQEQAKKNEELYNNIREYISKTNKANKYEFVLGYSKVGGGILFADPSVDVTNKIIEGLNKEYAATKGDKKEDK